MECGASRSGGLERLLEELGALFEILARGREHGDQFGGHGIFQVHGVEGAGAVGGLVLALTERAKRALTCACSSVGCVGLVR